HVDLRAPPTLHALHSGALDAVDGDHTAPYSEAGDLVGGYGRAAAGEAYGRAGLVDRDVGGGGAEVRCFGGGPGSGRGLLVGLLRPLLLCLLRLVVCRVGREPP